MIAGVRLFQKVVLVRLYVSLRQTRAFQTYVECGTGLINVPSEFPLSKDNFNEDDSLVSREDIIFLLEKSYHPPVRFELTTPGLLLRWLF